MKKRIMGILLIVVLAVTMMGCSKGNKTTTQSDTAESDANTGTKSEPVELTLWSIATESDAFHQPYLDAIKDFEAAHPGVTIKFETFENEAYKTKIKSAIAANELPDLFFTWAGGFSESFVSSGKVLPLDSYYNTYSNEISMAALNNDVYDGKLYGSVTCTPVSVMWYNKAMFEEQGLTVPTTWDEFKTVCQKFIDAGIKPIGSSVKDTWVLAMLHDGLTLKSAGAKKVTKALKKQGQSYNDLAAAAFEITKGVSKYAYLSGAGIPAWKVDYDASSVPAITQEVADLAAKATSYTLWFDTLMTSDDAGEYISLLQSLYTGDITPEEFVKSMDSQLSK